MPPPFLRIHILLNPGSSSSPPLSQLLSHIPNNYGGVVVVGRVPGSGCSSCFLLFSQSMFLLCWVVPQVSPHPPLSPPASHSSHCLTLLPVSLWRGKPWPLPPCLTPSFFAMWPLYNLQHGSIIDGGGELGRMEMSELVVVVVGSGTCAFPGRHCVFLFCFT